MIVAPVLAALLLAAAPPPARGEDDDCDFEKPCLWDLKDGGFKIVTGQEVNNSWVPSDGHLGGPFTDADNNTNGYQCVFSLRFPRHHQAPQLSVVEG
ncbi:hypothetical protein GE061_009581 [Apolygus lucorum]|uniref:Uncharacterized protein n=1 Tax=Apolygus lucorum TaxID=248454 RepID=A0A6A4K079_APOLU|nr:hypothetical protein GE061_009581 [Apolygus lucorum]